MKKQLPLTHILISINPQDHVIFIILLLIYNLKVF